MSEARSTEVGEETRSGPIAWMAKNAVAANLLMIVFLLGGLAVVPSIKQEVFPEFDMDFVDVSVPYPGASPAEVEQGILLAIEEEVRSVDGVKKITSVAREGTGNVFVELLLGTNAQKALQDVKSAVDRITSFPQDAERPIVSLLVSRREVISLVLYGDVDEYVLRDFAERVRTDLIQLPEVTYVDLDGVRPREISLEVPQENLRRYNLTLGQIAQTLRRGAVELPGGGVKTKTGEVLVRVAERRDYGSEFENLPVMSRGDGTEITVSDIGVVDDGFRDTDEATFFNGKPAVRVTAFRVGKETPTQVAKAVKKYMDSIRQKIPSTINVATWKDDSEMLKARMDLLMRNALLGLFLVLIILGIFLEIRLAFWVTLGIPISFLGALLLVPAMDVSINMISLFAFIISLGIVVDDAVVVGENIYEARERGLSYLNAAIDGAGRVSTPVVFSILTNIAAFLPMFFVPGVSGKLFRVIPAIVIPVFLVSLVESLFVLPSHLAHSSGERFRFLDKMKVIQEPFTKWLRHFIEHRYRPLMVGAISRRYLTLSIGIFVLLCSLGAVIGGHLTFSFLPQVESDNIKASVQLPYGTPVSETAVVQDHLVASALSVLKDFDGDKITRGILTSIGGSQVSGGAVAVNRPSKGGHAATVDVYLVPSDERELTAEKFTRLWRQKVGEIVGAESLTYKYSIVHQSGSAIDIQLSHPDQVSLENASIELAGKLGTFKGVRDINDGVQYGKSQLDLKLKSEARSLGITARDLAEQVRHSFYGAEALRQQRGRDEVRVMVRLPENERTSEYNIESLIVRGQSGEEVPLPIAADVERGRAYTNISRVNGRRVLSVTADVDQDSVNVATVLNTVKKEILPELTAKYPGITFSFEGEQKDKEESLTSLFTGFAVAMLVIYTLLAVPFKSYIQPLIVMTAIPFGIVGAVIGHFLMGYELNMISLFGIVALSGVLVNDSLVLVDTANRYRKEGFQVMEAIQKASIRRFRPIVLTSLTTFFGLAPMIFETSVQAKFLIPMAISLGFGILFATAIILLIVPSLYLIVEDFFPYTESGIEESVHS